MEKCKKIGIICACALLLAGTGTALAYASTSTRARAEESETMVEEVLEDDENGLVKKLEEWKETYLVPLLGGVSLTAIVSFLSTIVINFIRNKKLDGKLLKSERVMAEANEKLAEATLILSTVKEICEAVKESRDLNKETKDFLKECMSKMDEKLDKMESFEKVQELLRLLANLQVKIAKASDEAIASGIQEDIAKISNLVKEL